MPDRVSNTLTHPIDLSDGRVLAPGETADKVDLDHPHNAQYVEDGALIVGAKPAAKSRSKAKTNEENS